MQVNELSQEQGFSCHGMDVLELNLKSSLMLIIGWRFRRFAAA
jgi:hypothetical protein